jgi:hypothetical protein
MTMMAEQSLEQVETWEDRVNAIKWREPVIVDEVRWRDDVVAESLNMSEATGILSHAQRDAQRRVRTVMEIADHVEGGSLSPFLLRGRRHLKSAITLAQSQGMTAKQVTEELGLTTEDVIIYRETRQKEQTRRRAIAIAAVVGIVSLIALRQSGSNGDTTSAVPMGVTAMAPSLPPVTTVEIAPSTTVEPATTMPVPESAPEPVVTSPSAVTPTVTAKQELNSLNGGHFTATAGWCGRIGL